MTSRRRGEVAAPRQAANAGRRNQTDAAAAQSGSRDQTAAASAAMGNQVKASAVDGNLSAQPNAITADEPTDTIEDSLTKMAVENMVSIDSLLHSYQRLTQFQESRQRDLEQIAGHLERLVASVEQLENEKAQKEAQVQKLMEELESEKAQKEAQVQKLLEELESEKAQKASEVQKVMGENVRLHAMLDKKEAQLQAMSEQCKFMALNHHN